MFTIGARQIGLSYFGDVFLGRDRGQWGLLAASLGPGSGRGKIWSRALNVYGMGHTCMGTHV